MSNAALSEASDTPTKARPHRRRNAASFWRPDVHLRQGSRRTDRLVAAQGRLRRPPRPDGRRRLSLFCAAFTRANSRMPPRSGLSRRSASAADSRRIRTRVTASRAKKTAVLRVLSRHRDFARPADYRADQRRPYLRLLRRHVRQARPDLRQEMASREWPMAAATSSTTTARMSGAARRTASRCGARSATSASTMVRSSSAWARTRTSA